MVGAGSQFEGHLEVRDAIRVDGHVRGSIRTTSTLTVSAGGQVEADCVEVRDAVIQGRLQGRLRASHSVYLGAGACLTGRIETPRLIVEAGVRMEAVDDPSCAN